jgi:hypothetical protein
MTTKEPLLPYQQPGFKPEIDIDAHMQKVRADIRAKAAEEARAKNQPSVVGDTARGEVIGSASEATSELQALTVSNPPPRNAALEEEVVAIGGVVALLLLGGFIVWWLLHNLDGDETNQEKNASQGKVTSSDDSSQSSISEMPPEVANHFLNHKLQDQPRSPISETPPVIANSNGNQAAKSNSQHIAAQDVNSLAGIQGWLLFFVISLGILAPLLNLGSLHGSFHEQELAYPHLATYPEWNSYKNMVWLTLAGASAFGIYAAWQLSFVWKESSVTLAKIALVVWLVASAFITFVIPSIAFGKDGNWVGGDAVGQILTRIISTVIWLIYLSKSKRVKATYSGVPVDVLVQSPTITDVPIQTPLVSVPVVAGVNQQQTSNPSPIVSPLPKAPIVDATTPTPMVVSKSVDEDALYEQIGAELESGKPHTPTWLKAFAQANGDDNIAKANYIKLRFSKLMLENHSESIQPS